MKRLLALSLAAFLAAPAFGADVVFKLKDPRGDDNGDGNMIYPQRDDIQPGELDIVEFSASQEEDGTWFSVAFARPVAKPDVRVVDSLGLRLDQLAKYGFYNFNIDIYIDTDRKPGSGNTETLPGRKATIDSSTAWERLVCLTPRPQEAWDIMKAYLLQRERAIAEKEAGGRLLTEERKELDKKLKAELITSIFMPTKTRVAGNKVSFFVPMSFLGGPAKADWAYVVAVTGADYMQRISALSAFGLVDRENRLFNFPIEPGGKYQHAFGGGREDDPFQTPIVDLIVPSDTTQKKVLAETGGRNTRPSSLPGVVPAQQK
ncbi:MAG: hypothetical protein IT186_26215 [Acidobacteria bacterium]|nr:hypothetical protein [Acidobacteriota bacterium]